MVQDNHNYFAENILVHNNTDYDKLSAEKQLEELKKTETVLSGSASFSETPEQTFSGNINNTNTELFRQSLSDLITINKYQEIAKELDKKLLINAIEKGQFQYYGSLEQKVQVSKHLVESLRNELINTSPEEQSEILKAVNYWEQTYNDLRNESVEETLKERTEKELQALNLVLLLADAPAEVVSEIALSKLNTLVGSVGEKILALFKAKPEVVKTIEEILGDIDLGNTPSNYFPKDGTVAENLGKIENISFIKGIQLKTTLSFQEAGIIDVSGNLTQNAINNAVEINIAGGQLTNPKVIMELTKDGSKIQDWGKFTTENITLSNGQKGEIHFYENKITGEINTNIDYKVKPIIKLF